MSVNKFFCKDGLSDEVMSGWIQGLLSTEDRHIVQAHVDTCALCARLLEDMEAVHVMGLDQQYADVPLSVTQAACALVSAKEDEYILKAVFTVLAGVYTAVQTEAQVILAPWLSSGVAFRGLSDNTAGLIVLEARSAWGPCRLELSQCPFGRHKVAVSFATLGALPDTDFWQAVLFCENIETECQPVIKGLIIFEDLYPGKYQIELTSSSNLKVRVLFSLITP